MTGGTRIILTAVSALAASNRQTSLPSGLRKRCVFLREKIVTAPITGTVHRRRTVARLPLPVTARATTHAASTAALAARKTRIDLLRRITHVRAPCCLSPIPIGQLPLSALSRAACAAASIATGILKGEQLT